jgi:adenine phosphoribosyltransferase
MINSLQEHLKNRVRDVPNFPKEGILFKDITPVLMDAELCNEITEEMAMRVSRSGKQVQAIAGIESRGFFFGFTLANKLGIPFIPIRKAGKLPFTTVSVEYALEYGTAKIEMNSDAVTAGMHVLIHDDLLATGGTAEAAAQLIKAQGGEIAGFNFIIGLDFLNGSDKLNKYSDNINSIINF